MENNDDCSLEINTRITYIRMVWLWCTIYGICYATVSVVNKWKWWHNTTQRTNVKILANVAKTANLCVYDYMKYHLAK